MLRSLRMALDERANAFYGHKTDEEVGKGDQRYPEKQARARRAEAFHRVRGGRNTEDLPGPAFPWFEASHGKRHRESQNGPHATGRKRRQETLAAFDRTDRRPPLNPAGGIGEDLPHFLGGGVNDQPNFDIGVNNPDHGPGPLNQKLQRRVKSMCQEKRTCPSPRAFVANMRGPQPWSQKVLLLLRNNWKKLMTLQNCCGYPGEPGC